MWGTVFSENLGAWAALAASTTAGVAAIIGAQRAGRVNKAVNDRPPGQPTLVERVVGLEKTADWHGNTLNRVERKVDDLIATLAGVKQG